MSMDEEQFVTVTTYETELVTTITVPAHYSINEICEAIRSELEHATAQDEALTLEPDISTIFIASGEFPLIHLKILIMKRQKVRGARQTLPLGKLRPTAQSTRSSTQIW
jgi:hypothetical protein